MDRQLERVLSRIEKRLKRIEAQVGRLAKAAPARSADRADGPPKRIRVSKHL